MRRIHRLPFVTGGALAITLAIAGCTAAPPRSGLVADAVHSDAVPPSGTKTDRVLVATPSHPALTVEGDAVDVRLASSAASIAVTGPEVPGEGFPNQPESTTCTWTVVITGERGTTPFTLPDLTAIDHFGATYPLTIVAGQPSVPISISAGESATFQVRAIMRVGEGLMRWAPQGHDVLASWDFVVEND